MSHILTFMVKCRDDEDMRENYLDGLKSKKIHYL